MNLNDLMQKLATLRRDPGSLLQHADRPALLSLLTANGITLVLAMVLGWRLGEVVLLYWVENLVIGVFAAARILTASGSLLGQAGTGDKLATHGIKLFLLPFFCIHYFGFCLGHGFFLTFLFSATDGMTSGFSGFSTGSADGMPLGIWRELLGDGWTLSRIGVVVTVAVFVISHGVSFFRNYLGRGEYLRTNPHAQMFAPYGRIVLLHVCIVIGAMLISAVGSSWPMVVLFMVGKTFLDAGVHVVGHEVANSEPNEVAARA